MTFHAYFQYVCLFIVWLCAISPTRMYAQKYRQQSDTHRTLLVVDKETGRPIEGAYILLENQPLASSTGGRIIIPWKTNSKDTVLVQSLGYKSQYIYLSEAFKKVNIQTVYLYPEIKILEEVIITGECSGVTRNTVSNNLTSFAINRCIGNFSHLSA